MATPYAFHYDLVLLTIAQAFFLRHALQRGFTPHDAMVVLSVNTVIAMFSPLGFPTGFIAGAMLLAVILYRWDEEMNASEPALLEDASAAST